MPILPLLYNKIDRDEMNAHLRAKGFAPVYTASAKSRIVLVGQAPGRIAQETRNKVKCLRNFLLFLDHDVDAEVAEHNAEHNGNVIADDRNRRKRIAQQACNDESDEKSDRPGNDIACRHLAQLSLYPH